MCTKIKMFPVAYIIFLLLWSRYCFAADKPCVPRDFNEGSIVCVCNSTYCDTVESVNKISSESYWVITSAKDGRRFQKQQGSISDKKFEDGLEDVTLTIDKREKLQTIFGFGGAFTDAATINIMNISQGARNKLMQSYFSPKGIEYTFGRVPIGGCDFSPRPYTYDDDHDGDFNLTYFNLPAEDLDFKIPVIQQALAMSNRTIKMFASPWSAPAWMKTNNDLIGAGTLKGAVGGEYYQTWAEYYIKFLEAYKSHNISFWGLTAQNEPLDGYIPFFTFNCMGFKAESQRVFISQNLGPTLAKKGFGNVKLMILDDQRLMLPGWAKEVLRKDDNAKDYVDGIAFHWYLNFIIPPSLLTKTHNLFPDKFLLATESCEGSQPMQRKVIMGDWIRGENYAQDIIEDLLEWTTGWVDWNICLNEDGGPNWMGGAVDSPIIVSANKDEFYKQPMYYTLGHFSKYVVPGSVVIKVTSTTNNLWNFQYVAFERPDNSTIITLLNRKNTSVNVVINDKIKGSFQVTSPARSIQTYIWWN